MSEHRCDTGHFDRTLCPEPCGYMHSYCTTCGERQDPCAHDRMTADHPTPEERYAAVLAEHQWSHTKTTHCACGWRSPLAQLAVDGYLAHVAAALVAADTEAAQVEVALSDDERERIEQYREEWGWHDATDDTLAGYGAHMMQMLYRLPRDGHTDDMKKSIESMLADLTALAARAAQPVPAPEVSRGVAEAAWDKGWCAGRGRGPGHTEACPITLGRSDNPYRERGDGS